MFDFRLYTLNESGEPEPEPDTLVWAEWLERSAREGLRHVGDDDVGSYRVSTIFLGTDHGLGFASAPVLWETMIFGLPEKDKVLGRQFRKILWQERYSSKADALAGHARAVKYAQSLPSSL